MTLFLFFFNDTATTEIYTLSLHDALPICWATRASSLWSESTASMLERFVDWLLSGLLQLGYRSEEHTSELQSLTNLVCRLLLEIGRAHDCTPVTVLSLMSTAGFDKQIYLY